MPPWRKQRRKRRGWQPTTESHRQHSVWGPPASFHKGTAGLKVKDYFEICIPAIKLLRCGPPAFPPAVTSLSPQKKKKKKLSPQSRDELGANPLWWQRRILLFPNPPHKPFPSSPARYFWTFKLDTEGVSLLGAKLGVHLFGFDWNLTKLPFLGASAFFFCLFLTICCFHVMERKRNKSHDTGQFSQRCFPKEQLFSPSGRKGHPETDTDGVPFPVCPCCF